MAIDPKALVKFALEMAKDVAKTLSDRLFGGREQPSYAPPPPPPPRPRAVPDREVREAYSDTESPVEAYSAREEPEAPEVAYAAPAVEAAEMPEAAVAKAEKPSKKAPKAEKTEKAEKTAKAEKAEKAEPAEKPAKKSDKAAAKAEKPSKKPEKAPKKPAKAEKAAPAGDDAWARYFATLPDQSKRFVELLEQRRQLTIDEAVEALGVSGPKAIGGLTGAMSRWAPKHGAQLPFEARTDEEGKRLWVWTGA